MASVAKNLSDILVRIFGSRNERVIADMLPTVARINAFEPAMRKLSDAQLRAKTDEFKDRLTHGEILEDLLPEAFAAVREASRRTVLTPDLDNPQLMRHFDVQLIGGIVLHQGCIAEMVTGEGKTLVATLAAYLNALTGRGVHLVTVNDYLARRDRDWMGPMYEFLGLTAGAIQADQDYDEKRAAYACDITFGTDSEFGFDYLRDNMANSLESQVQKDRHYAIVDEVDSVLIDEARTPLIISGPSEEATDKYYRADEVARRLKRDAHFVVKEKEHSVHLTEEGNERVERLLNVDSIYAGRNSDWPHHIEQALRAHSLYKRDVDYISKGGEIIIVDEFTGRLMPGRRWSDGLHQAVEAKERLKIKAENQTLATVTYQNFFRLYGKLAGMTGTALTEATEFDKIYKLDVLVIPTNKPLIRHEYPDLIYCTEAEKLDALEEEVVDQHATGRPLLVGTISIEKSELLGERLKRRGIKREVLNAKHHEREAQIVANAGQMGTVTIATNMAGRGTDIVLGAFTEEQLLDHWQANGLAPKDLKLSAPRDELERRLVEQWAQGYLDDETLENTPREEWGEKLRDFWRRHRIPPLKLCTSVAQLGGLHIVGTERHEARRIDNQLRGRAGRQGDPGSSRFFLSLQDDLMRIFAADWVRGFLHRLGLGNGMPIESRLVTRRIEGAQRKVEEHNFEIRKHLLEYDEVMDEQRKAIYGMRQQALEKADLKALVIEMVEDCLDAEVDGDVATDAGPEMRNYQPLVEWARGFGVKFSPEEWASSNYDALRALFVKRARESLVQEQGRDVAARCVRNAADLFLGGGDPFPRWDYSRYSRWARKLGLAVEAEELKASFRDALISHYAGLAVEQHAGSEKSALVELCVAHAVGTFLGSYLAVEEWDFRGFSEWGSGMGLSIPVSQWQQSGGEEAEGTDAVAARREEIQRWLTQRLESAFRSKKSDEIVRDLVGAELNRLMDRIEAEKDLSEKEIVRWINRTMDGAASISEVDDVILGKREEHIAGLAEALERKLEGSEPAEPCLMNAHETFLQADLAEPGRDLRAVSDYVGRKYGLRVSAFDLSKLTPDEICQRLTAAIREAYDKREAELGSDAMREIEKFIFLQKIDTKWKDHLYAMDHLKSGIGLRGYGQVDPKVEYTREARKAFDEMMASVRQEVTDLVLRFQLGEEEGGLSADGEDRWGGGEAVHPAEIDDSIFRQQEAAIDASRQMDEKPEPVRVAARVGRNDPCPCGSGKKFKKCCGRSG